MTPSLQHAIGANWKIHKDILWARGTEKGWETHNVILTRRAQPMIMLPGHKFIMNLKRVSSMDTGVSALGEHKSSLVTDHLVAGTEWKHHWLAWFIGYSIKTYQSNGNRYFDLTATCQITLKRPPGYAFESRAIDGVVGLRYNEVSLSLHCPTSLRNST